MIMGATNRFGVSTVHGEPNEAQLAAVAPEPEPAPEPEKPKDKPAATPPAAGSKKSEK